MSLAEELKDFPLFRSVDLADLEALAKTMEIKQFEPSTLLFSKGDPGDSMYLIRSGQIRVFMRDTQGHEITFRHYGKGQLVGEFSILDGQPRSAFADAVDALEVWILERSKFVKFLNERPILGVEMMRSLAERIRYTTNFLEHVAEAVQLLSSKEYERAIHEILLDGDSDEISGLISTFLGMVKQVQEWDQTPK